MSRSSSNNWARGYKTYRKGELIGFVPALDRLSVRQVSARFLSQNERIEIADLRSAGQSVRQIAARLGRAPSTISRELRRNVAMVGVYRPFDAHRRAMLRRARHHARPVETNMQLRLLLTELLGQRWSPQQISRYLRLQFPNEAQMRLSHQRIFQALYEPGSALLRPSKLAPHRRSPLRTGRDDRLARQSGSRRRPRFQEPMLTIHQRPFDPDDRSQAGHWEGDLIVGKEQGSAIGTLVERQGRMVRLLHLPRRDGDARYEALTARMGDHLPAELMALDPLASENGNGPTR